MMRPSYFASFLISLPNRGIPLRGQQILHQQRTSGVLDLFPAHGEQFLRDGTQQRYLQQWMNQLRWQRLQPMEKLADMLVKHLPGILNYCKHKVPLGVVEAINGNIKALLRRGRGYRDMNYLLLKAQRLAFTKTEFIAFQKAA